MVNAMSKNTPGSEYIWVVIDNKLVPEIMNINGSNWTTFYNWTFNTKTYPHNIYTRYFLSSDAKGIAQYKAELEILILIGAIKNEQE